MNRHITVLTGFALLAGCATPSNVSSQRLTDLDLKSFAQMMTKDFETAVDDSENKILDRRVRITSPDLKGAWLYTQLNTGADKKLYRQRVSNLTLSDDKTAIIQRSYQLETPENFVDLWDQPQKLSAMTDAALTPFADEGCAQKWKKESDGSWYGHVDPEACVINSKRRNKQIRIEAEGRLSANRYQTNERGFTMEMEQMWGTAPGDFITLYIKNK